MYFVQVWLNLSDEGTEDECYDSRAARDFVGCYDGVPDATTLANFRHLIEDEKVDELYFEAVVERLDQAGLISHGITVVDSTIVESTKSTKNERGERDPKMHQTKKGESWRHGMKVHTGEDALGGYVHTVTFTPANTSDIAETHKLLRGDDECANLDSGYRGIEKRPEIKGDKHLSSIKYSVAMRPGKLRELRGLGDIVWAELHEENRKASTRARAEHPYRYNYICCVPKSSCLVSIAFSSHRRRNGYCQHAEPRGQHSDWVYVGVTLCVSPVREVTRDTLGHIPPARPRQRRLTHGPVAFIQTRGCSRMRRRCGAYPAKTTDARPKRYGTSPLLAQKRHAARRILHVVCLRLAGDDVEVGEVARAARQMQDHAEVGKERIARHTAADAQGGAHHDGRGQKDAEKGPLTQHRPLGGGVEHARRETEADAGAKAARNHEAGRMHELMDGLRHEREQAQGKKPAQADLLMAPTEGEDETDQDAHEQKDNAHDPDLRLEGLVVQDVYVTDTSHLKTDDSANGGGLHS